MHPEGHLLLDYILGQVEPATQLLRTHSHALVFDALVLKAADHHGVDGHALEVELPIEESESQVHVAQVIVKLNFAHGFFLGVVMRIFVEHILEDGGDVGVGGLVVDGPVALRHGQAVHLRQRNQVLGLVMGGLGGVDFFVEALGVFHILDDNVAGLQGSFAEPDLEQLYVLYFLIDVVVLGTHELLSQHVLVLIDEGLLGPIQVHQHCHQVALLVLDPHAGLVFLHGQDLPPLGRVLVFVALHLLNVLLGGDLHELLGQLRVVLYVVSEERDNASEGVVTPQQVVLDGESDAVKNEAMGVDNLQDLEHVDVLVEDIVGEDSWNEQPLLHSQHKFVRQLIQLNNINRTSWLLSMHSLRDMMAG